MGGRVYGMEIGEEISREEASNIESFATNAEPVIICGELEDLEDLGIQADEVTMVEPSDD